MVVTVPDTVRSDVYAARISAGDAGPEACSIVSSSSHEMKPLPVSVRTDSLADDAVCCEPLSIPNYGFLLIKNEPLTENRLTSGGG